MNVSSNIILLLLDNIYTATPNPVTPAPQAATLTPISCNTSQTSSTSGLAPANIAACGTSTGTGGAKWYKLTGATAGQTVTITTCSATTDFDTKLSVWGDKNTPSTCIGGNDDDCNLQSTVTFEEASGDEDILVHGYSSSEGTFELSVTCVSVSNWFVECFPPFLVYKIA